MSAVPSVKLSSPGTEVFLMSAIARDEHNCTAFNDHDEALRDTVSEEAGTGAYHGDRSPETSAHWSEEIELVYIAITATMQDVTEDIRGHVIEAVDMFHDAPERDKQCICQSDDKEEHIAHGLTAQLRHTS